MMALVTSCPFFSFSAKTFCDALEPLILEQGTPERPAVAPAGSSEGLAKAPPEGPSEGPSEGPPRKEPEKPSYSPSVFEYPGAMNKGYIREVLRG